MNYLTLFTNTSKHNHWNKLCYSKYLHKARGIALPLRVNELFSAILCKYPLLNKGLKMQSTCTSRFRWRHELPEALNCQLFYNLEAPIAHISAWHSDCPPGQRRLFTFFLGGELWLISLSHLLHPGHLAIFPLVQFQVLDLANVRPHASVTRSTSKAENLILSLSLQSLCLPLYQM